MRNAAFLLRVFAILLPFLLTSNAYSKVKKANKRVADTETTGFYVLVEKLDGRWKMLSVSKDSVNRKNPNQEIMFVSEGLNLVQPAFLGTRNVDPKRYSEMCSYAESEDKRGYSACNSNLMKFNSVVSGIDKFTNFVGLGVADKDHRYNKYIDTEAVSEVVAQSGMMAKVKQYAAEEEARQREEQEKQRIALEDKKRLEREKEVQLKLASEEKERQTKAKEVREIHKAFPLLLIDKQGFEGKLNSIAVARGMEFQAGPEDADPHVALKRFTSLATARNKYEAIYDVGMLYYEGKVVKQDYKQAFRWCSDAADKGCADAEAQIGYMYGKGEGVKRNMVQAAKWLRLAEAKGYENAPPKNDFASVKACIETSLAEDVNYSHYEVIIKSIIDVEAVIKKRMNVVAIDNADAINLMIEDDEFFRNHPGSNIDLRSGTGLLKDRGVSYKFSSGEVLAANYTGDNGVTFEITDIDGAGVTLKNKINSNYLKFRYDVCARSKGGFVDIYYEDLVKSIASESNKKVKYSDVVAALNRYYKEKYEPKGKSLWQLADALLVSGVERDLIATDMAKIMRGKSGKKSK
ncbi:tetratricopeptide repeat protein [Geomonas oryzae]|uniref:tetratricopeptide repeat protein n=1 Tax=Geomonas oryzae TaxID=2364273 RepID=UPI00100BF950|nr:sel1 repeat family protein [Geomonas oryzae]